VEGLINIAVNEKFPASGQNTITSYVYNELKIPALQLEISADWRNPDDNAEKYAQLVSALSTAITEIQSDVTKYFERSS
jgi:hypothetical protein